MSEQTRHTVDPRFTYRDKRTNKDVVLYQGLLDAAHRAGLMGTSTEILQYPHAENDHTTIVRAVVTQDLGEGFSRSFSGIGDANPRNVGPNIAPHAIRMAETRAKARAFRDMLNVGMVTLEELGGEDDDGTSAAQAPKPYARPSATVAAPAPPAATEPPAPGVAVNAAYEAVLTQAWKLAEAGRPVAAVKDWLNQHRHAMDKEQRRLAMAELAKIEAAYYADAVPAERQTAGV